MPRIVLTDDEKVELETLIASNPKMTEALSKRRKCFQTLYQYFTTQSGQNVADILQQSPAAPLSLETKAMKPTGPVWFAAGFDITRPMDRAKLSKAQQAAVEAAKEASKVREPIRKRYTAQILAKRQEASLTEAPTVEHQAPTRDGTAALHDESEPPIETTADDLCSKLATLLLSVESVDEVITDNIATVTSMIHEIGQPSK
ncbi:hypothetical protein FB451DRAFT_1253504 [Mycena latifolia]|nr:hypothetical protein FB451DRAFT_1253504 [Mycena latifolia]